MAILNLNRSDLRLPVHDLNFWPGGASELEMVASGRGGGGNGPRDGDTMGDTADTARRQVLWAASGVRDVPVDWPVWPKSSAESAPGPGPSSKTRSAARKSCQGNAREGRQGVCR